LGYVTFICHSSKIDNYIISVSHEICLKLLSLAESGTEDARLSYIRNLMVNYLSSDAAVREHMEGAIGTVLKFSSDDIAKIAKKKQSNEAWF
jgi:hypothetical protein